MQNIKRTALTIAVLSGLLAPTIVSASDNSWEKKAKDAWIDGKAEATLLFNGNLNSFDINTDVLEGTVTLTGNVNSKIDRELAEELVMGIEGVNKVNNKLTVMKDMDNEDASQSMSSAFVDSKILTVVKSRFLFDSQISGTNINVDVKAGVVTLNGTVESASARDLALAIARNTKDVSDVKDMLEIQKPES